MGSGYQFALTFIDLLLNSHLSNILIMYQPICKIWKPAGGGYRRQGVIPNGSSCLGRKRFTVAKINEALTADKPICGVWKSIPVKT